MTDFGSASVTVRIDSRSADREVRDLLRQISNQVAGLRIQAETRQIRPAIEGAIASADTDIALTATGAREIAGEVTAGVEAGDSEVALTATGASEVAGEVDAGIEAGDSEVNLTATGASEISGEINAGVQAADTQVNLTADPEGLLAASGAAGALNSQLIASSNSGTRLRTVLQVGAFGAIAKAIYDAGQAASDMAESTSKAEQVFKSSTAVVTEFSDTAATSVGLASRAALESAATFGNLFTAMEVGRADAAAMSTEVIQLGADLASFNNLGVDETLDRIRSGLVGEIEPLRSLGISFNAAQVEAKAMELGLAEAGAQVSEGAKVQARLALITEQSSNAQGDFARTSEGLANQQRILRGELQNAIVEIGQGFLPLLLELVKVGRSDLIPAFVELGTSLGGVVVESLDALIPLLGATTTLLVALAPAISAVASIIEAIPDPVLQLVAAFVLFNRIAGPARGVIGGLATSLGNLAVPAGAVSGAFDTATTASTGLQGGLKGLLNRIGPTNLALGAGAVAFTLWSAQQAKAAETQRQMEGQLDTFTASLDGAETAVLGISDALQEAISSGEDFTAEIENARGAIEVDYGDVLRDAGLTTEQFAELVVRGDDAVNAFAQRMGLFGQDTLETGVAVTELSEQFQESAKRSIDASVALGTYSERQVDTAVATATATGESKNYAGALEILKEEVDTTAEEQAQLAEQTAATSAELSKAVQAAPGLADALRALRIPGGNLTTEFNNLAIALANSDLSADQMQAVAATLGVSLDDLGPHVEAVRGIIQNLQATAGGAVPGLDSIAQQVEDLSALTAPVLRDTLSGMLTDLSAFNDNIQLVLAERPLLAGIAAQAPEFAALLGRMIRNGRTAALDEMELLAAGIQLESAELPQIIENASPAFIAELEALGLLGTSGFAGTYKPETPARTAQDKAKLAITNSKEGIGAAARGTGRAAHEGYAAGTAPIPENARVRMANARAAIEREEESHRRAGKLTGSGAESAYRAAIAPVSPTASATFEAARLRIREKRDQMFGAGSYAGKGAREGLEAGLPTNRDTVDPIVRTWKRIITGSVTAIFDIRSPARVMVPYGAKISEGLIQGIASNRAQIRSTIAALGFDLTAWLGALFGGTARGAGFAGLQEPFASQVAALIAMSNGAIYLISGWRSAAQQVALYADYVARGFAPPRVAKPGTSKHEQGLAVDLGGPYGLMSQLAHAMGFKAPVPGEPWHWQPGWTTGRSLYEHGAWDVERLGLAHPHEMVLPRPLANLVRQGNTVAAGRAAASVVIQNLVINVPGAPTPAAARVIGGNVARGFETTLALHRISTDARIA